MDIDTDTFLRGKVAQIRDYCAAHGISETAFGIKIINDWRLVQRIEAGKVTVTSIKRAEAFIAGHASRQLTPAAGQVAI